MIERHPDLNFKLCQLLQDRYVLDALAIGFRFFSLKMLNDVDKSIASAQPCTRQHAVTVWVVSVRIFYARKINYRIRLSGYDVTARTTSAQRETYLQRMERQISPNSLEFSRFPQKLPEELLGLIQTRFHVDGTYRKLIWDVTFYKKETLQAFRKENKDRFENDYSPQKRDSPISASKQLAIACLRSAFLHRSGPWA